MAEQKDIYQYVLRLADNCLILGQRLTQWCGHGPVLEQDIALTNIALDLIGQARNYYQYATKLAGNGTTEDDIAFLRTDQEYNNLLLVEQPNGDFAHTILRQYIFDVYHHTLLLQLQNSKNKNIAAIAQKSIKEVTYHKRWSSQWVLRLGDGTDESHHRMIEAIDDLWPFAFESITPDALDKTMAENCIGVALLDIAESVKIEIENHLIEATLEVPKNVYIQQGGKTGFHGEHLGYLLVEMQYLQRAFPGATW